MRREERPEVRSVRRPVGLPEDRADRRRRSGTRPQAAGAAAPEGQLRREEAASGAVVAAAGPARRLAEGTAAGRPACDEAVPWAAVPHRARHAAWPWVRARAAAPWGRRCEAPDWATRWAAAPTWRRSAQLWAAAAAADSRSGQLHCNIQHRGQVVSQVNDLLVKVTGTYQ